MSSDRASDGEQSDVEVCTRRMASDDEESVTHCTQFTPP